MQEGSVFGTKSIIFFVVTALLVAALLNQLTSLVLSVLDNDFTKGVAISASAIFIGNFILQQNQRRREEEKAVSEIVLNLSRIAKKLHRIGCRITASNKLRMNPQATLRREERSIIFTLCNEILELAREARTLSRDINKPAKWYFFSTKIDNVTDEISSILNLGFSLEIYDESNGELKVEWAIVNYVEIIYPLEMEIYKALIEAKKYIEQEYWSNLSSEITERIQDREFKNWTFSMRLNPQAGIRNLLPEYVLSKFNSLREEVAIALEKSSSPISSKEEQADACPSS